MIGKNHKGALVIALPVNSKKAHVVTDAIDLLLTPIRNYVQTITFDNGKEFTLHEKIAESIQCDTYFAKQAVFSKINGACRCGI